MRIEDIPKGCLRTNSGLFINIFEPKPEMICVEDIAHGCGRQPRFGNQLDRHYSVAQHCMKAAEINEQLFFMTLVKHLCLTCQHL
jgi:hypothetical protein